MSTGVPKATDVVDAFLRVQQSVRQTDLALREAEFIAQNLEDSRDQEAQILQQFTEGLQKTTLGLSEVKKIVGKVQKDAWVSVQVQSRVTTDVKGLETTVSRLSARVTQLSQAYKFRKSVLGLLNALQEIKKPEQLPDLRSRIVKVLRENPQMPIGMLMHLHIAKAQIDEQLRAVEELAKKREEETVSSKRLPILGNEATYLAKMVTVCRNSTPPETSVIEAMQADFDQMPEDLRNAIYTAIAKEASQADDVLVFGKANLFKDLPRFVKVVSAMPAVEGVFKAEAEKLQLAEKRREAEEKQLALLEKQRKAEAEQRGKQVKSKFLESPVHGEAADSEALLKQLAVLSQERMLKADKEKRGEALHALFNEMAPREFKLAVYKAIGEHFGRANKAAEQYGREHFADSFTLVREAVTKVANQ